MKPSLYTLLLTTTVFTAVAQDIHNTKTDAHILVPGTRVYIVPAEGFHLASSFTGLEQAENVGIQVTDLIGGNYYTNAADFTTKKFQDQGGVVFEYKEFKFDGFPAKYMVAQTQPGTKFTFLIFGDTTFSTALMAAYPSMDKNIAAEVKKTLESVYYDSKMKVDYLASAAFTLNDQRTALKFAKASAGMLTYALDGKIKEEYKHEPMLTTTTVPNTGESAKTVSNIFVANMGNYGFKKTGEEKADSLNINGVGAYEVSMYGEVKGEKKLFYQLVYPGKEKVVVIQGISDVDFEKSLARFKELAHTIKFKQ